MIPLQRGAQHPFMLVVRNVLELEDENIDYPENRGGHRDVDDIEMTNDMVHNTGGQ